MLFWNKAMLKAFLRTCAISTRLFEDVYHSAQNRNPEPPIPSTWLWPEVFKRIHYAPMHTLSLGQIKSNIEMNLKWMAEFELKATFGKQANVYLTDIRGLGCSTYFDAQPFSKSTWGTGTWVSDNYAFFGRTHKFWCMLPCFTSRHSQEVKFCRWLKIFFRFNVAAMAALSCIFSEERVIPRMDSIVKLYLDALYEMDQLICLIRESESDEQSHITQNASMGSSSSQSQPPGGGNSTSTNRRKSPKKQFNFTKSVSLATMLVAESHDYFGPAILHHEGGFHGERKIQKPKAFLHIKRKNADWPRLVLERLNQEEMIEDQLNRFSETTKQSRRTGLLHVYKSREAMEACLTECKPLSGVLLDGHLWLAYRPKINKEVSEQHSADPLPQHTAIRSAVTLQSIPVKDEQGLFVSNLCWCALLDMSFSGDSMSFKSIAEMEKEMDQYILCLPRMSEHLAHVNSYFVIGHKWTERISTAEFVRTPVTKEIFSDWIKGALNWIEGVN